MAKQKTQRVDEQDAVDKLVEHIREVADLDDLAKYYSQIISDDVVIVKRDGVKSDPYLYGEVVKK